MQSAEQLTPNMKNIFTIQSMSLPLLSTMEISLENVVVYFHVHVYKHVKASDSRTHNSRMSLSRCLDEDEETNRALATWEQTL